MRFRFKRAEAATIQAELDTVQETLCSGYFLLIDLFFWSIFLTLFTLHMHYTFSVAIFTFSSFYLGGLLIFLTLNKILQK